MGKCLALCLILIISSGCATPIYTTIDLPPRPNLVPVTLTEFGSCGPDAQDKWVSNDLLLKQYILKLEARIEAYNDTVD